MHFCAHLGHMGFCVGDATNTTWCCECRGVDQLFIPACSDTAHSRMTPGVSTFTSFVVKRCALTLILIEIQSVALAFFQQTTCFGSDGTTSSFEITTDLAVSVRAAVTFLLITKRISVVSIHIRLAAREPLCCVFYLEYLN